MTIRLLIGELEHATQPICDPATAGSLRRVVRGWPRVSHPILVRRWLGEDSVAEDGGLADPEAAGHALAWLRWYSRGWDPDDASGGPRVHDDQTVCSYLASVVAELAR